MSELNEILHKLEQLHTDNHKSWLASLTEQSAVMLDTRDIAAMTGYSYDHVYKHIVSRPDFPPPMPLGQPHKRTPKQYRKWLAGDVVKFFRKFNQI